MGERMANILCLQRNRGNGWRSISSSIGLRISHFFNTKYLRKIKHCGLCDRCHAVFRNGTDGHIEARVKSMLEQIYDRVHSSPPRKRPKIDESDMSTDDNFDCGEDSKYRDLLVDSEIRCVQDLAKCIIGELLNNEDIHDIRSFFRESGLNLHVEILKPERSNVLMCYDYDSPITEEFLKLITREFCPTRIIVHSSGKVPSFVEFLDWPYAQLALNSFRFMENIFCHYAPVGILEKPVRELDKDERHGLGLLISNITGDEDFCRIGSDLIDKGVNLKFSKGIGSPLDCDENVLMYWPHGRMKEMDIQNMFVPFNPNRIVMHSSRAVPCLIGFQERGDAKNAYHYLKKQVDKEDLLQFAPNGIFKKVIVFQFGERFRI
eukprot:TRINITY_DN4577_c0_g1_i1.p1 TRINITY_DN4577_c0_g1~~TRINITY_DN4577_c0_g1_i1.p1  ORF type:complete len:377 (+),score=47.44 TRINITY_DN4577_c0_g1_i1:118-1248(+)